MESFTNFLAAVGNIVWGPPMLILLVGTHLFLTFRLRFIQGHVFKAIKLSVTKDPDAVGDVSQFGALTTALAATIGTGNIVGVATAVAAGGPGAILWCWLTGLFGIATKYGEGLLAIKYRVRTSDGSMLGGPMYALEKGMKQKWLGVLFAVFAVVASFGIGNMTQANSITQMLNVNFNISPVISGIVICVAGAFVIIGGIKTIASVCEKLVPFMALFYILGCIAIIILNVDVLGQAIALIFTSAFTPKAAAGGFIGSTIMTAMRFGIARGLFSNESGLGSAPIAAAAAQTRNSVRQALVSMTGVFWDTVIVCALTGIVLTTSIIKHPDKLAGLDGGHLTSTAFSLLGTWGSYILAIALTTFAFSTILGWSYYGEKAFHYLFGKKASLIYRVAFVLVIFWGSVQKIGVVWDISDIFNALMAIPNLISLLVLSPVIVSETRKYLWNNQLDLRDPEEPPLVSNR